MAQAADQNDLGPSGSARALQKLRQLDPDLGRCVQAASALCARVGADGLAQRRLGPLDASARVLSPQARAEVRERLRGRRVIASISGGKDSGAASLLLAELGIEHERVFMDTGWEHPWTYEYIRGPLAEKLGPIRELRADPRFSTSELSAILAAIVDLPRVSAAFWDGNPMVALCLKKGMFPAGVRARWCTDLLKRDVILRHFETLIDEEGAEIVNCVGIRAEESAARSALPTWELLTWGRAGGLAYDCDVFRPVLHFRLDDVIAIHRRHNLAPNPLYLQQGIARVGCAPCINERKSGIRALERLWPERFDLIRELEQAVGRLAALRIGEEPLRNPRWRAPSWFMASGGGCVPIERVLWWARTLRGGRVEDKQEALFVNHNDGCMRWGLCEATDAGAGGRT